MSHREHNKLVASQLRELAGIVEGIDQLCCFRVNVHEVSSSCMKEVESKFNGLRFSFGCNQGTEWKSADMGKYNKVNLFFESGVPSC